VGRLHRHENLAFLRLGLKDEFEKDILEEAQNLVRNFRLDDGGRIDLTSVPTATVDALGAKEFDDALSLEPLGGGKVRLGLHIADVASIVPPMSLIDRRAMVQPCSIYLPEARYPMLPEILTEEVASLKVGENRPALSLLATIDSDGQVLDWRFVPSVVYVDLQVSFIRATEMLETGNGAMLEPLEELAQTLLKRRLANDGQNLGLPHMNVNLDSGGQIEVHINDDGNRANQMVGELMILANHLAARTLMEANIPCPYRFQLPSRPLGWTPPVNPDADMRLAVGLASRRQTGRVGVTLEPAAHHGLGLTPYTSFTSPMRRYIDLLVARQMRAVSTGSAPSYSHQDMMNLAIPAEATHRAIRKMQNERQRYWLAQYLQSRVNEEFFGLVYDRRGPRLRICVTEFMLELELGSPHPPGLQPGARVPLRLTKVKPGADLPDEQEDFWRFEFSQRYRKPKAT
jgi:exoribonuclease-2